MGIEIIHYHANDGRFRIKIGNVFHRMGEIDFGASVSNIHLTKTAFWFTYHHQIAHAFSFIFSVITGWYSWFDTNGLVYFRNKLLGAFVETYEWACSFIEFFVKVNYVFHSGYEFRAHIGNTPFLFLPRFQSVSYTHLRAHETVLDLVCRLLLEKKKKNSNNTQKTML